MRSRLGSFINIRFLLGLLRKLAVGTFDRTQVHAGALIRRLRDWWWLPPGRLDPLDRMMRFDQRYLLRKSEKHGPIFKVALNGGQTTCIVGHARARRLLVDHEDSLHGATVDLRSLFPIGHLRAMRGTTHLTYRRQFIEALQAISLSNHRSAVEELIRSHLQTSVSAAPAGKLEREPLRSMLRGMTASIMFRILLGVTPQSPEYDELIRLYREFGPAAPVRTIRSPQRAAFSSIRLLVRRSIDEIRSGFADHPSSVLSYLASRDQIDETTLGNLIYMVDGSHFDLYSLWAWITYQLATHPDTAARFRSESDCASTQLAQAIVQETLRLEQSESISRLVTSDIKFEGYRIPQGTAVRACLWEGHKDPKVFTAPFAFIPQRFLSRGWKVEEFAPFGLDKHHCIAAEFVMAVSALFVETLLKAYRVDLAFRGAPHFGAFHWEPGPEFAVRLVRTDSAPAP